MSAWRIFEWLAFWRGPDPKALEDKVKHAHDRREAALRVPKTHELRLNGVEAGLMHASDYGRHVTLSGWTPRHWQWTNGDYLVLISPHGRSTRYRIESITRPGDPSDVYFADCRFAPRGLAETPAGLG